MPGLADTSGVAGHGSDTGGEFGSLTGLAALGGFYPRERPCRFARSSRVLCEFRDRLLSNAAVDRLLARVLDAAREDGLLKARGRSRTDGTHVLAATRALNRLELLAETLHAALNDTAVVAPDWLRAFAPPEWHERYDRRIEDVRLPKAGPKRDAFVGQVGADAPQAAAALPVVETLRRVWARHFEPPKDGQDGGARRRPVQGRGPGDRLESPYDTEARFRTKANTTWTGTMVHFTETCDAGAPRLVVHADAIAKRSPGGSTREAGARPANVHDALRTAPVHAALAAKGLAPSEHLMASACVSADHLITAQTQHGIALVGPGRPNLSWQSHTEGAFTAADFAVDWDRQKARCPEGKDSAGWYPAGTRT